jgi:hypothetical protein
MGQLLSLDAKIIEFIKNEPVNEEDPILVLDYKGVGMINEADVARVMVSLSPLLFTLQQV